MSFSASSAARRSSWAQTWLPTVSSMALPRKMIRSLSSRWKTSADARSDRLLLRMDGPGPATRADEGRVEWGAMGTRLPRMPAAIGQRRGPGSRSRLCGLSAPQTLAAAYELRLHRPPDECGRASYLPGLEAG